jgi:ribonuclease PH
MRIDGRRADDLREVKITTNINVHAEGSALIEIGQTKVICTATIEEKVPLWMRGQNRGWIHAEYSMLPRATKERTQRESAKGKQTGRTMEIQRLIARSLRSVVDLKLLGERTITIDCDVIQADGGTRTAAITGGFVAMAIAIFKLVANKSIARLPIMDYLASTSVGVVAGKAVLDLNYIEDSSAHVDMNVVMTGRGLFVEVQGTGEEQPYSREDLNRLLELAELGTLMLIEKQKEALGTTAMAIGGATHASQT